MSVPNTQHVKVSPHIFFTASRGEEHQLIQPNQINMTGTTKQEEHLISPISSTTVAYKSLPLQYIEQFNKHVFKAMVSGKDGNEISNQAKLKKIIIQVNKHLQQPRSMELLLIER